MEDSDEFKCAVKVVIKRQMRDLMEQLRDSGEEVAVMTVNLDDNTCSHFGSPNGEWFMSEQKDITQSFLNFCQSNTSGDSGKKSEGPVRTASPPKKKSISSLKDTSIKQNMSNDIPEVKVTVPKSVAGDLSEEDVAALVGRIVATHLAVQEKGDGSSSGTQFDILVRTANHSRTKNASSVQSTPARSSRKRKPTAKYMEGMSTLKKSKKSEEEDTGSEMEAGNEEVSVISLLSELSNTVLRRVKVSISDNKSVNLERYNIDSAEITEALAVLVINELDTVSGGHLANKKSVKVCVVLDDCESKDIKVHILSEEGPEERNEDMDDSDMEYLDEEDDNDDDEDEDYDGIDNDEYEVNMGHIREIKVEKETGSYEIPPRQVKRRSSGQKRRAPSELRPSPCPHCDTVLTGVSSLNAHVRRVHLKQRNYACTICDKRFFTSTHRDDHFRAIHTKKCPQCNLDVCERIAWTENMISSSRREVNCECGTIVHLESKYGRFKQGNELFDENGKSLRSYQRPRKRALTETMPMECEQCGMILKGKSSLNAHIRRMHLMARDHVCTVCSKAFYTKTHLESHMLSLHARRCQVCQEYVMESEPWTADVDRWTERTLVCSCGASVTIVTKLGRKPENGSEEDYNPKKRVKRESAPGARYVCGSCGKIFLKKKNAMSHSCSSKEAEINREDKAICDVCKESFESEAVMREHVTKMHAVQQDEKGVFTVEGEGVIIDEDNQVVMFEETDAQTALSELADGSKFQVMHDGKLVPFEQLVDTDGNVISFIIKQD